MAEEQGEHGNPFESRPMWQECRHGESNAWDEAGEVGRSLVTEVFTGCSCISEQQYREVSESFMFKAGGPGVHPAPLLPGCVTSGASLDLSES